MDKNELPQQIKNQITEMGFDYNELLVADSDEFIEENILSLYCKLYSPSWLDKDTKDEFTFGFHIRINENEPFLWYVSGRIQRIDINTNSVKAEWVYGFNPKEGEIRTRMELIYKLEKMLEAKAMLTKLIETKENKTNTLKRRL